MLHDLRLVRGSLVAQVARLDRVERELAILARLRPEDSSWSDPVRPARVVRELRMEQYANGSVLVVMDDGKPFVLSPRLAQVFGFLAARAEVVAKDGMPAWMSRDALGALIRTSPGVSVRLPYVNHVVYLLRCALRDAGYDPSLIQTHRREGVRLALRAAHR
jgi:DNA-binding winged helix-turn-helix (wHTH) protein